MICPKCEYQQYQERIYTNQGAVSLWKCIACGNATDEVILRNRERQNNNERETRPRLFPLPRRQARVKAKSKVSQAV